MYKINNKLFLRTDSGDEIRVEDIRSFRLIIHETINHPEKNYKQILIWLPDTPYEDPYRMSETVDENDFIDFLRMIDDDFRRLDDEYDEIFSRFYETTVNPADLREEDVKNAQTAMQNYMNQMFGG